MSQLRGSSGSKRRAQLCYEKARSLLRNWEALEDVLWERLSCNQEQHLRTQTSRQGDPWQVPNRRPGLNQSARCLNHRNPRSYCSYCDKACPTVQTLGHCGCPRAGQKNRPQPRHVAPENLHCIGFLMYACGMPGNFPSVPEPAKFTKQKDRAHYCYLARSTHVTMHTGVRGRATHISWVVPSCRQRLSATSTARGSASTHRQQGPHSPWATLKNTRTGHTLQSCTRVQTLTARAAFQRMLPLRRIAQQELWTSEHLRLLHMECRLWLLHVRMGTRPAAGSWKIACSRPLGYLLR